MSPSASCQKCRDMRCACGGSNPGHVTYLGQWAQGPSDQGEWCTCCLFQLVSAVQESIEPAMSTLLQRFLVTLSLHPDEYVREVPVDPTNWNGRFPCWHPTNCVTLDRHTEKLKKSRSKAMSRASKLVTGFDYAFWPFSYDQLSFPAPFPYIVTGFVAGVILEHVDAGLFPPNPSVVVPGGYRVMGEEGRRHL